ncbi:MAG: DUF4293 domain-containing protein [Saprospiraceae bacterium]|nr:DUF4293 domain-containing protein [Lewinella sp.]
MIQRIQSIFLALAAIAAGGLFGLPFATTSEGMASSELFADSVFNIKDNPVLMIAFLAAGALSLIAVFLFNNRKLQMTLSIVSIIATIIGLGLGLFFFMSDSASGQASFGLGTILPVLMIVFLFLGWRNIKKDEKLVRSMDRLR